MSLPSFIAQYKATVTRAINTTRGTIGKGVWQRNYYEHIIRHARDFDRIRWYIRTNPERG